jgi:hypothetical protein
MAKKSRRTRAQVRIAGSNDRPGAKQSQPAVAAPRRVARQSANVAAVAQQPVNYDYVKSDLVQIGIIAGVLILIIIVLTFVPALK